MIKLELTEKEMSLLILAASHGLEAGTVPEEDRAATRVLLGKLHAAKVQAESAEETQPANVGD